jgi:hypothetical protein
MVTDIVEQLFWKTAFSLENEHSIKLLRRLGRDVAAPAGYASKKRCKADGADRLVLAKFLPNQ